MPGNSKSYALIVLTFIVGLAGISVVYSRLNSNGITPRIFSEAPSLWYSPLELDFGPVGIGDTSSAQAVRITNMGAVTLNFTGGEPEDENFSATHNCAGGLAPGESCQFFFRFIPQNAGVFTATGGPLSDAGKIEVVLRGTGVGPDLTYNAHSLDFGKVLVGNSAGPQAVTIKNTGMAELTFSGGTVPDPFSVTQNCAPGLMRGETCKYFYSFTPTSSGDFTITTGPSTNAGKQVLVDLKGQGIISPEQYADFYVSPLEIDFGPLGQGLTSDVEVVTITNQSDAVLSGFTGSGVSLPFEGSQDCAGGVPPFQDCHYFLTFKPSESGVFSATSNSSTNLGPFTITMQGTGQGASLSVSPLSIDFGPVQPGTMSEPQVVTITNTGPIPLTNLVGGGVLTPFSGYRNCADSVAPGESCQYTFFFTPAELGRFTTSSDSSSNGGTFSVQLEGGVRAARILKGFLPAAIAPGGLSTLELSITNPNPTVALNDVAFDDTFPPGMRVASPLTYMISAECGEPLFSPGPGDEVLSFSGGTIPGGKTCLTQVAVTADAKGYYPNQTGLVGSGNAGLGNFAAATLFIGFRVFMPIVFD